MAMSLGDVKTPRCGDIIHRKKLFKLLFYTKVHVSRIFFLYNILSDNRLLKDGTFFAYKDYNTCMCNLENNFSYYLAFL